MLHFAEAAKDATVPSSSSISDVAGVAHVNIEARGLAVTGFSPMNLRKDACQRDRAKIRANRPVTNPKNFHVQLFQPFSQSCPHNNQA